MPVNALLGRTVWAAGWPTPCTQDGPNGGPSQGTDRLPGAAAVFAGWPTPTVGNADGSQMAKDASATGRRPDGSQATVSLNGVAQVAGWATPVGPQANGTPEAFLRRKKESVERGSQSMGVCLSDLNMQVQAWAGWPTHCYGKKKPDGSREIFLKLPGAAKLAGGPMRLTSDGRLLTGSSAGMESGGQLNPAHSRWLMGYPPEWDDCAVTAMPSTREQRQSSSKPSTPQPSIFD